jgi:tetratricopeptide (TPR) repeat protein
MGSLAVLAAITGAVVWLGRTRRYLPVGWLWFLGTMIPALKIYGGGLIYSTASRFAYLPFIGLYLILAFGAEELARRGPAFRRGVVAAGVCAVAALFLAGRGQLAHWQDSLTLFRHTIEATGGRNPYMRYSIGLELERRGDRAGALQEYRLCLADDPDYVPARLNVGNLLLERGRLDEAAREYRAVLENQPGHYYALANLGVAAFLDGRREEGEELTRRAMARDPGKALAYANLARMRRAQGDPAAARALYRQALEREPDNAQARRALEELGG